MDGLREYVISVTAAAFLCGILAGLFRNSASKDILRLLCGLFLAIVAIRPIVRLDFAALEEYTFPYGTEAESTAAMGENMARKAMADIIKAESEAYILDKADSLNTSLCVEISVSEDGKPIPVYAEIRGEVSPYARAQLEEILLTDLGIAKENQQWTG